LLNDSTINIQGWVFKIIYLSDSVLRIVDNTNDTIVLQKHQYPSSP